MIDLQNPNSGAYTKVSAKLTPNFDEGMTVNFFSGSGSTYRSSPQAGSVLMQLINSVFPTFENGTILPWATVNGNDWATVQNGHIVPFGNYTQGTVIGTSNVGYIISANPTDNLTVTSNALILHSNYSYINSLKLDGSSFRGDSITISSGGILALKSTTVETQYIYTPIGLPLHIQNYTGIGGFLGLRASIDSHQGIIHSGNGTTSLRLGLSNYNAAIYGDSFINGGRLVMQQNQLLGGIVTVRTGSSSVILESQTTAGGLKSDAVVILDGIRANEWNAPIFRLHSSNGVNVVESFNLLQVEGRGVLEFEGSGQRKLHLNHLLVLPHDNTGLDVKGWENWVTFILVKKTSPLLMASLPYINFEGHAPGAVLRDYSDANYWEIVPFPEPSTYGAIFGVMGLGLWAWRRRVRKASASANT